MTLLLVAVQSFRSTVMTRIGHRLNTHSNSINSSMRQLSMKLYDEKIRLAGRDHQSKSDSASTARKDHRSWLKTALLSLGFIFSVIPASYAADTAKVGLCLLQSCQKELAQCILNPKCLANVICINTCNNRKDEAECQIGCGNLFENDVVGVFNSCAVSQKKCVPRKYTPDLFPLPNPSSMVKKLDTSIWNGRWYISAGLNKAFDTFDCQVHFFTSPEPGTVFAKLFWRITEPDDEYFTRNAIQKFVQDPNEPGHLLNHDNEYLHYKDDWYVLDYEPNDFVLVYYRGSNDAWDGYGGAFLYTRSPSVRPDLFPRLEKAVANMGLQYKWSDFTLTDNSCKPQQENPTVLREKFAKNLLITEEQVLQEQLTGLRNAAVNSIEQSEPVAVKKSIEFLEKEFDLFQKEVVKDAEILAKDVGINLPSK
jgi:violaxanthin de-epoxidase